MIGFFPFKHPSYFLLKIFFFLLFRYCLNLVCFLKFGKHLTRSATIRLSTAVSAEECIELICTFITSHGTESPQYVQLFYHHPCIRKSLLSEPFSSEELYSFLFSLKFFSDSESRGGSSGPTSSRGSP